MTVKLCSAIVIRVLYVLCLYYAQISGERLQDHWSIAYLLLLQLVLCCVGP